MRDMAPIMLEESYAAGLADPEWMRQNSHLDNIRHHPRYVALVKQMESNPWFSALTIRRTGALEITC